MIESEKVRRSDVIFYFFWSEKRQPIVEICRISKTIAHHRRVITRAENWRRKPTLIIQSFSVLYQIFFYNINLRRDRKIIT